MRVRARFATTVAAALAATGAAALPQTYVSTSGRDAFPCHRDRPCRTVTRALAATDAGGSLVILDSGRFAEAPVTVTRSVTIVAAPGALAELTAPGGSTGVLFVNAGVDDVVVLRNLVFTGQPGAPLNGIVYNQAHALHVEDCVVSGFPTKGILALFADQLFVKDSVFRGNFIGVSVEGVTASLDGVRLEDNEFGLFSTLGAEVTVRDSVAAGNTAVGFLASVLGSADPDLARAALNLEDCMAANNGTGVKGEGFDNAVAWVRLSRCVVTGNGVGVHQGSGGVVETRQNSTVRGNGSDVVGALTAVPGV